MNLMLLSISSLQDLGIGQATQTIWDQVRENAPIILAIIFVGVVLFNISKVVGAERDYKGFIAGILMYFFGVTLLVAGVTYLLSLSF